MDFKQRNTRFLFPVFIVLFLIIYLLNLCGDNFSFLKSYNLMSRIVSNSRQVPDDIALIIIDDKSIIGDIARWPWRRELYLEIFDYFETYTKAKLVGYDAIVTMPDVEHSKSDKKFFSQIKNFKKLTAGVSYSDKDFAKDIDKEEYNSLLKLKSNIKVIDKRKKETKEPASVKSFSILIHEYFKNVNSVGAITVPQDSDGYIRRTGHLINYNSMWYPSLAFKLYSRFTNIEEFILTDNYLYGSSKDKKYVLKAPVKTDENFVSSYINYYKTDDMVYSHSKYSASDIIYSYRAIKAGKKPIINPEEFDDKIIFVGANAQAQALADVKRTPISEGFQGTDIVATSLDNLLTNNFYSEVNPIFTVLTCILIVLFVFYFVNLLPITIAMVSCAALGFMYFGFSYLMYSNNIAIDILLPEFYIVFALLCAYSYKYLIEDTKKTKIQKAMGKYLSYDIMQNVVQNIDNIELGGKRADITVLFADIRNFTSISEKMDAASTSMILNEYFSALVPIIEEHNGVLNKFMGDAVLAIFGEPKKSENHALDAVTCGYKMLKKVKYLQEKWIDEGKPKIEIGIGISSGDAFVGNIGSQERLEYTVIGDTVNTASRIENYNKVYRTNFLISEETYKRTKNKIDVITIKDVVIRGKANRVNLYEVIRLID